ncbi:hypothetical protein EYF80_056983 [Liparis tanakae]|uniref:Uncharacterized protein n=1 Tax=Liparis tanakae TaxID=230148 RepID=A0A4Z2EVE3_9TELE|nr:hypothetical protein EYF80_056983 [Liparis tanakae]
MHLTSSYKLRRVGLLPEERRRGRRRGGEEERKEERKEERRRGGEEGGSGPWRRSVVHSDVSALNVPEALRCGAWEAGCGIQTEMNSLPRGRRQLLETRDP